MTISALIFDLGGVLLRTLDPAPRQRLAERFGMSREALEELVFEGASGRRAQRGEITVEGHWSNLGQLLKLDSRQMEEFRREFWSGDRLDAELVGLIRAYRRRYRTALLSNAFSNVRWLLETRWGIADAFDEMVISSEVGRVKPDPAIYQMVVERLGVALGEALMVDDFVRNVEAARAVGLQAVQFRDLDQLRADFKRLGI